MSYLKLIPSNLSNWNVWCKIKIFKQKCLICAFLEWNLKILLSYMKSVSSNLCCCKVWCKNKNREKKFCEKKQKYLNQGPEMPYLGILGQNLKTILSYLKSTPRICLIAKFREKTKMPKFLTKMRGLCILWLGFENTIIILKICVLEFVLLQSLVQ